MVTDDRRDDRPSDTVELHPTAVETHAVRWWARTVLEVATLLGMVVLAEASLSPAGIGSPDVHPHPYWLVVLPMASTRGMVAGLVAAVLSSAVLAGAIIVPDDGLGFRDLLSLDLMLEPVLMFAGAFLLGEIRDERESRIREREQAQLRAEGESRRLRRERDVLLQANRAIESRLVDHSVAFGNMIVAAARVEGADRDAVFEVALDLIEEHCGALASVLDVLHDQSVELLAERGWEPDRRDARLQAARDSLVVRQAIREGRRVNAFAWNRPPERGPLLARPVLDGRHVVSAVICMDDVPPSRLNSRTVTTFFAICEWIEAVQGRQLAEAAAGKAPSQAATISGAFAEDVARPEDLGSRLRLELARHLEHGVPVSLIAIQIAQEGRTGESIDDVTLVRHLASSRRVSDGLYRFGFPGCYVLVLADTPLEHAPVVAQRMEERARSTSVVDEDTVLLSVFAPMEGLEDMASLLDAMTAHFREHSTAPLSSRSPVPAETRARVLSLEEFGVRLEQEVTLAGRRDHPICVASLRLVGGRAPRDELLLPRMRDVVRHLSPVDTAARLGENHAAVLIPHATEEEARERLQELIARLDERQAAGDEEQVVLRVLTLGMDYPDASALYAELFATAAVPSGSEPRDDDSPVPLPLSALRAEHDPPPSFPRFE